MIAEVPKIAKQV